MKKPLNKHTTDLLWHSGKAALCALQLWILDMASEMVAFQVLSFLLTERAILERHAPWVTLLHPAITLLLFFLLWRYYDSIDDRSFNRFCAEEPSPNLLRDRAYRVGMILTVALAAPILTASLYPSLRALGLSSPVGIALSALFGVAVTAGGSLLRVRDLNLTWAIQKDLPHPKIPKLAIRILYAVIYFVALYLALTLLATMGILWGAMLLSILKLLVKPVLIAAAVLLVWSVIVRPILRIRGRRKFMHRLYGLRDRGELSMEIHGHPYLSLFSKYMDFGLTIVDAAHPDGKKKGDTTYRVALADCKRRRGTVILCDRHIYQFVYTLQFNQITRFSAMGAASRGARTISVPGASWYTNHTFSFPEGDGERILLIDPTPYTLAIHGQRAGELQTLDNASHVYEYTVYGKNSFVNLLERL